MKCIAGIGTGSIETQHGAKIYTLQKTQDWLQQHPEIQTINTGGASTIAIKQIISQINYSDTGRLYVMHSNMKQESAALQGRLGRRRSHDPKS